mgnify:CR=1 FL=1
MYGKKKEKWDKKKLIEKVPLERKKGKKWASDHKVHAHVVLTSSPLAPGESVDLAVVVRRIGF